ncbi:siderophore biosynthesis enzyme [Fusarium agapanthi]|uniref:Siderophore biosynthesis enzyme n=1 Tax=Fusarium agapanthi TaxID=1803897 RepID=A0A9P5E6F6_9HYPO|nr:siderophore biosynthesis enzyme [Fusarium agapanthi]
MAAKFLTGALIAAVPALAKTDLAGCTSYDTVLSNANGMYASRIWYVPDTGELCDFLDCGGGRAPPKTTVPGCPGYVGTATYSPLFINPKTLGGAVPEETGDSPTSTEEDVSDSATITAAPTTETESETESKDDDKTSTDKDKDTKTITTLATHATPSASSGAEAGSGSASGSDSHSASHSDSSSETDAAATPASTVSTAGAVMPTAGAFLAIAGAAMYAGML